MTFDVDPDWWKELFDELYMVTDARSVNDSDVTRREIDLILEMIPLSREDQILDLCGGHGRHSIELFSRGFQNLTVLDFSQYLIERGRSDAKKRGMPISFVQEDARHTGLPPERFDHILLLGNSLGYLPSPDGDGDILAEAMRLLKKGGYLLIDIANGEMIRSRFNPFAWHEIGEDIVVCRQRELDGNSIHTREMVLSKKDGLLKDCCYSLWIYGPDSFSSLLSSLGFTDIRAITDFSPLKKKGDFGFMNARMVIIGQKPQTSS